MQCSPDSDLEVGTPVFGKPSHPRAKTGLPTSKDRPTHEQRPAHPRAKTGPPTSKDRPTHEQRPVHPRAKTGPPTTKDRLTHEQRPAHLRVKTGPPTTKDRPTHEQRPAHPRAKTGPPKSKDQSTREQRPTRKDRIHKIDRTSSSYRLAAIMVEIHALLQLSCILSFLLITCKSQLIQQIEGKGQEDSKRYDIFNLG
jgi:hypothetical protein